MQNLKNIDEPLNVTERYLYNINIRLNILIEMMSSFLEAYATQNNIAITNNEVVEEKVEKPKKKKKTE